MDSKILLIDNSVPLGQSIKFILSRIGYDIEMTEDGESAIVKLRTGAYGLVIIDLKDFNSYGESAIKFLHNGEGLDYDPSVLILSIPEVRDAVDSEFLPEKAEWLMIPFSNEKLIASVRKLWE